MLPRNWQEAAWRRNLSLIWPGVAYFFGISGRAMVASHGRRAALVVVDHRTSQSLKALRVLLRPAPC
jgi:hypothetical protein